MNADDNLYRALDLQPGASPEEIRSAYRRLAKLYHPDKDPSLDGEMRYREIRLAYDALRQRRGLPSNSSHNFSHNPPQPPRPPKPPTSQSRTAGRGSRETFTNAHQGRAYQGYAHQSQDYAHQGYATTGNTGWWYVEEDETFDFSDLMWEYGGRKAPKKRVAFGWEILPRILWEAFKEAATLGMAVRVSMTLWGLWFLFGMIGLAPLFRVVTFFFSLIAFLLFRYYDTSPIQVPTVSMLGSMLYSLGIGFLCAMSSHRWMLTVTVRNRWGIPHREVVAAGDGTVFIVVVLFAFFALLPLWAHPLIWLENGMNSRRTTWPR